MFHRGCPAVERYSNNPLPKLNIVGIEWQKTSPQPNMLSARSSRTKWMWHSCSRHSPTRRTRSWNRKARSYIVRGKSASGRRFLPPSIRCWNLIANNFTVLAIDRKGIIRTLPIDHVWSAPFQPVSGRTSVEPWWQEAIPSTKQVRSKRPGKRKSGCQTQGVVHARKGRNSTRILENHFLVQRQNIRRLRHRIAGIVQGKVTSCSCLPHRRITMHLLIQQVPWWWQIDECILPDVHVGPRHTRKWNGEKRRSDSSTTNRCCTYSRKATCFSARSCFFWMKNEIEKRPNRRTDIHDSSNIGCRNNVELPHTGVSGVAST